MLSRETIKGAIAKKEIEITVSFYRDGDNLKKYDNETPLLSSELASNLYSDRLKITLGPIVKVLDKNTVESKYRFKNVPDCYDLRKSDNKYTINPGESIIILTNERIKLNENYACIVVPRISLSDVGIVVTTAYVDPFYDGLMRLHLTNFSDKSYELFAVEAIAQCFFFELTDPASEKYKESFSTKSVFFGQTWDGIINSDRNPFPTKKAASRIDKYRNIRYQWNIICSIIKKHSLILMLLTNIILFSSGYAVLKQEVNKYVAAIDEVEDMLVPASTEIIIESGQTYGDKEIIIDCPKSEIVSILCDNDDVHYRIISGDMESETKIIFSYTLPTLSIDEIEVSFSYAVIRRMD